MGTYRCDQGELVYDQGAGGGEALEHRDPDLSGEVFSVGREGGGSAALATALTVIADALDRADRTAPPDAELRAAVQRDGQGPCSVFGSATSPWDCPDAAVLLWCDEQGL